MPRHGSLAEQLAEQLANPSSRNTRPPKAANDNKPRNPPAYRGTLPALRWLYDNRPDLAPAFASALPRPAANWFVDVEPTRQEIRPTVGEIMAASHDNDNNPLPVKAHTAHGYCYVTIGGLKFRDGELVEWGVTKKGRKLRPADRARTAGEQASNARNPYFYLSLNGAVRTPMDAEHYHRPMSGLPAIASMYDPLPGVEASRAILRQHCVDGSQPAPAGTKRGPTVAAEGAGFLGGVCNSSGTASSGALMWDGPEERESNARVVIEEVASRGTLKSIGLRLGYSEADAIAGGKQALIEVAEIMKSIRDKKKSQIS